MKKKIKKSAACQFQKAMLKSVNISHVPVASVCPAAGELQSVRWLIIISKVPCHSADLNKRVLEGHLHASSCLG